MKISFFSNFLNPHQLNFCKEMIALIGDEFTFVATAPFNQAAVTSGFKDMNSQYPFCLTSYSSDFNRKKAMELCEESDVLITGSAPECFFRKRIKTGKITFRYTERIFKPLYYKNNNLYVLFFMFIGNTIHSKKPLYLLSASAYTPQDFSRVGAYKDKAFKWGYFPQGSIKTWSELRQLKDNNATVQIICACRLIQWKHLELALEAAKHLKENKLDFSLKIFGDGEELERLQNLHSQYDLSDCVEICKALDNNQIIEKMEQADIFLATSDYNEGWGAVINEAMSAGCGIVASTAMGSVPYLLTDEVNGFTFPFESKAVLFEKTARLVGDIQLCRTFGKNAKETINSTWNSKVAAKNLVQLSSELMQGTAISAKIGPCEKI